MLIPISRESKGEKKKICFINPPPPLSYPQLLEKYIVISNNSTVHFLLLLLLGLYTLAECQHFLFSS